ncbi:4Fe-4S dicluster domain-containing protein [Piscinibacter sakaiensis]|uniref:ATP-binding protein n=1 Tax=Piscinibacter sakaiensis TaxID=1547922 RepID=UPI0009EC11BF|nr:4Fe-4S dicluster domain-containing protein [Piscinibacter sakaiensis]
MSAKARPLIDPARCTGCGRCVAACAPHVLWLEAADPRGWGSKRAVLHDPSGCTGCADCLRVCPFDAVAMRRAPEQPLSAANAAAPPAAPAPGRSPPH